ncbi:MAG: insulinase family protein [Bdellovibrionales bacterium]|nr:insulinase family protein [Bdellovibrionales bacterium]
MKKPEELFLSNGIPVILQHFDGPVGTLHWWNLTGSTDERPEEAGFAHFLEHMLFKDAGAKDTGRASTGQTARVIESLGGEINAYTTFDQTVYHVTCSEQYWEEVMDNFSIMAKPQRFLKSDFEREREVILEELRRGEDSPDRQLYQNLFSQTYHKHPYGRPVIGYVKTLKAANVKKLEAFYNRRYVSEQMGLVLVGPIDDTKGARKKKILNVLEKRFGKRTIPKKTLAPRVRPTEPVFAKGARFQAKHFDIKTSEFAMSFRVPELMHDDSAQLEVLSGVLGMGESSRLYQSLFYEKSLVTDASASLYVPRDPGMFLVSAELKNTANLEGVMDAFLGHVKEINGGKATKEEIERVVHNIESEKLYSTQTVDGLAGRLGFLKYSLGDLNFDAEYIEKVKAVTPSTLKRLSETYLVSERMSGTLFQPKDEALYSFRSIQEKLAPSTTVAKAAKPGAKTPAKGALEPEIFRTDSGLHIAYYSRPSSPVYSMYLAAFGGTRSEIPLDPRYWGASHLLAQIWAKGTGSLTSKQISHITEGAAASLDGFSGRNTIGLQSTALVRDWDKLSNLFEEVLFDPSFSEEELAHAKRVTEEMIRSIPDHSSQVCSRLFMENLFTKHPYAKSTLGDLDQLQRLKSADLKALHHRWIQPKNMTLSIVGGIGRGEVESFANRVDSKMRASNPTPLTELSHIPAHEKLVAPRWAHASYQREQTHIMMGSTGISMHNPDRYALRLMQNILGGQSGRLFIELREKRSMAYTVSPMVMEGLDTGYVGTYIACSPSKAEEALAGMKNVLETLIKKGPTEAEMTRAKNYYLGQRAMDLQSTWSLAGHFGLELLYRDSVVSETEIRKKIEQVSAKQVQKVGEKLFLNQPSVTVTVA